MVFGIRVRNLLVLLLLIFNFHGCATKHKARGFAAWKQQSKERIGGLSKKELIDLIKSGDKNVVFDIGMCREKLLQDIGCDKAVC